MGISFIRGWWVGRTLCVCKFIPNPLYNALAMIINLIGGIRVSTILLSRGISIIQLTDFAGYRTVFES